jgi:hypothetical protein
MRCARIPENAEVRALDTEAKTRKLARIAERIDRESIALPYRWGYFQGAILIPWSLFLVLGSILELRKQPPEPLYILAVVLLIGLVGLPLSVGLLLKKRFALVLVYAMVSLTLLLVATKIPVAMRHYTDHGETGSVIPEAEMLLVWLLSMLYYRKRQIQFR